MFILRLVPTWVHLLWLVLAIGAQGASHNERRSVALADQAFETLKDYVEAQSTPASNCTIETAARRQEW
jgi:hypothetical protein